MTRDHIENSGYRASYRANEINHCPGCGRTHWFIGSLSAECAFCATAIPLQGATDSSTIITKRKGNGPWVRS